MTDQISFSTDAGPAPFTDLEALEAAARELEARREATYRKLVEESGLPALVEEDKQLDEALAGPLKRLAKAKEEVDALTARKHGVNIRRQDAILLLRERKVPDALIATAAGTSTVAVSSQAIAAQRRRDKAAAHVSPDASLAVFDRGPEI